MSIKVWVIDDDEYNRVSHNLSFVEYRPDIHVITFECLSDASLCDLDVDYIFIDLGAVDARTIPCFDNNSYIRFLQNFVEKHCSEFIVLIGALISHAEEDVEDLKDTCPDSKLFALDSCDIKNLNPLVKFVNKYSPIEKGKET